MKKCTKCNLPKDPEDFYRSKKAKDGLESLCKVCHDRSTARYRRGVAIVQAKHKKCSRCKAVKPAPAFNKTTLWKCGLGSYCKACKKEWKKNRNQKPVDTKWRMFISARLMHKG